MAIKLFIDCGGYDGCSVIKFLLERPGFKCITFEPNPIFAKYYRFLPTRLIPGAVSTRDGFVDMLIDPIDGDGSSLRTAKKIDATGTLDNLQCPRLNVRTFDLATFIEKNVAAEDYLVLKLDVEGEEYAILDRLIDTGTIRRVAELFIEFHGDKIGMSKEAQEQTRTRLAEHVAPHHWDARSHAIHGHNRKARFGRIKLLANIYWQRLSLGLSRLHNTTRHKYCE